MVPLVINDDLSRLIQINQQNSVGQNGANALADVTLIQSMLNNLPETLGGPVPKLKVDGKVGPMTIAAIMKFQRAARTKVVDGRIDPLRPTIRALGQTLNSRNLMPRGVIGIGAPDERVVLGLTSTAAPLAPRRVASVTAPATGTNFPGFPTDWTFATSSGVSISALIFGVAAMEFHLIKDSRPGFTRIFPWSGIGVGLSTTPVGLDISFADFPSLGFRLIQGLFGSNPMPEDDFNFSTNVISFGANIGVGIAGTLCLFGALGPIVASTRAVGFIAGMEVGIPGAGITGFFGVTGKARN